MARGAQRGDGTTRDRLAIFIVSLSVACIAAASGPAIGFSSAAERMETTRLVFSSVLPLLGTWVGTVLAFYFARENLEKATESTLRLARQLEPQTPVRHVMLPRESIVSYNLGTGEDPGTVKLVDLYRKMRAEQRQRLPIVAESGAVLYVVHESTTVSVARRNDPGDPAQFTETIGDLLRRPAFREYKKAIEAIGFVGIDATLADARKAMRSVERCNDVFVTMGGRKDDQMVGWLTNTDLASLD
jgi:hypothetical protein